jgi:hypothetical protein
MKAGAGDVGRFDQTFAGRVGQQGGDKLGGQVAGIHLELLGQLHRDVAGDVAVRGVARAFQHHVRRQAAAGDDGSEGILEQGGDFLFL